MEEEAKSLGVSKKDAVASKPPAAAAVAPKQDDDDDAEETDLFATAREDLTDSQHLEALAEKKKSRGAKQADIWKLCLDTIPGSSHKPKKSSPCKDIPKGLVSSVTKSLGGSSTKAGRGLAAREILFRPTVNEAKALSSSVGAKKETAPISSKTSSSSMSMVAKMRSKSKHQVAASSSTAAKAASSTTSSSSKFQQASAHKLGSPSNPNQRLQQQMRAKHAGISKVPQPSSAVKSHKSKDMVRVAKKRAAVHGTPKFSPVKKQPAKSPALHVGYNLPDVECFPEDNYAITDTEASDYESDDDYNSKSVPDWARTKKLQEALKQQNSSSYKYDPDVLFGKVSTCDLVAIFNVTDEEMDFVAPSASAAPDSASPLPSNNPGTGSAAPGTTLPTTTKRSWLPSFFG
jgi:hypothetical protein